MNNDPVLERKQKRLEELKLKHQEEEKQEKMMRAKAKREQIEKAKRLNENNPLKQDQYVAYERSLQMTHKAKASRKHPKEPAKQPEEAEVAENPTEENEL